MRAVRWVFAVVGGCALIASVVGFLVQGDPLGAGWELIGPGPIYAVGLAGAFRGRGHPVALWLLAGASLEVVGECLNGVVLPYVSLATARWVVLAATCASTLSIFAGFGLIALFPAGRPDRSAERIVFRVAAAMAVLLPLFVAVTSRWLPRDPFGSPGAPSIASPLFWPAARSWSGVANLVYQCFIALLVVGLVMLYLRYRRSPQSQRQQVRLALTGLTSGLAVFVALLALAWIAGPGDQGFWWAALLVVMWIIGLTLVLGSLIVSLSPEELLGIDESARRILVHRGLRVLAAIGYVAIAATLGILASRYLPYGFAIAVAAGAALLFQPALRRLERFADRWAFGARLDGYDVLSRFGARLRTAPEPGDLLSGLAEEVCQALRLRWVRVRLEVDPAGSQPPAGEAGEVPTGRGQPEVVVPLIDRGETLGVIECGPRRDGPLLEEDRRLIFDLAGQSASAVRNLYLSAQLGARLELIKRQAAELAASRARVVAAQDAERRRIQHDLHDGFQQDVVVLTAKLSLARERFRRGDERAGQTLDELQADLGGMLAHLREFAHSIHPPVLADQGLLDAIEAQAARMPVEVVIDAEPALRGVRYPRPVEAATWYVVSEALTNAVKHAGANRVSVALAQPNGRLTVQVSDDGCGFDLSSARGYGLAGLADRMAIVRGELTIDSKLGRGTTLRAEVPLHQEVAADG
jgi:signal transduction histidine kinase